MPIICNRIQFNYVWIWFINLYWDYSRHSAVYRICCPADQFTLPCTRDRSIALLCSNSNGRWRHALSAFNFKKTRNRLQEIIIMNVITVHFLKESLLEVSNVNCLRSHIAFIKLHQVPSQTLSLEFSFFHQIDETGISHSPCISHEQSKTKKSPWTKSNEPRKFAILKLQWIQKNYHNRPLWLLNQIKDWTILRSSLPILF